MKKIIFIIIVFAAFLSCNKNAQKVTIGELTCEYTGNPLGIDVEHPRFSWNIVSGQRDIYQQSYQIIVSESLSDIKNGTGKSWDSGKTDSDNTVNIEYNGTALKSNTDYFWRVRVWTNEENFIWSEPATFHTGLFDKADWKAKWITTKEEIVHASPLFRKEFKIDKKIAQAFAFVTAGGNYEFYLNGKKVGDHVLDPEITDYRKTILYSTYEVTQLLKNGTNVAGAMLGNGAYNMRKVNGRYSWGKEGAGLSNPCLLAQLDIIYADGSQSVIATDESWKHAPGPITFNNIYGGEDYDARKEITGWATREFKNEGWSSVIIAKNPRSRTIASCGLGLSNNYNH